MVGAIYAWGGSFGLLVFLAASGLVIYLLLSGASYGYFFMLRRARFHPDFVPDRADLARSFLWAAYSIVGNVVIMFPFTWLVVRGHSRVYHAIGDHGWLYFGFSILLLIAAAETMIYWIHRWLHEVPFLFRHIHRFHHKFHVPTPWASMAFHPLDSSAQALPYHLCALLFPLHESIYLTGVGLVAVWSVSIHDHVAWVSPRIINNAGCHSAHHWFNRFNYGQYFTFWDRWCGTYKHPDTLPERFFAAKGLRAQAPARGSSNDLGPRL